MKRIHFQILSFAIISLILISCQNSNKPVKTGDKALAEQVKSEFQRSWNAYKTYAWGHDVLLPVSKSFTDWYQFSLHISPIDAYSTMRVMGLDKEAAEVQKYVIDSVDFDRDIFVKTFEVNIRILGGLLSMYQFTMDKKVLAKAEDFGRRMLPAFDSPTGIPYYWVNLKTGAVKGAEVNVAEGGSYLLEMGVLSAFTGNPVYYEKAKNADKAIFSRASSKGLIGQGINIETGEWTDTRSHIGCCIDSYYEYLYKAWVLFHDPEIKEIWDQSIIAINKYIADTSGQMLWYGQADMTTGKIINHEVTLYDAYFPAVLLLSGDTTRAEQLQHSWDWLWNHYGLEPSAYDYKKKEIIDASYDLNPEIIESACYLYQFTGKEEYLNMVKNYFTDILSYCKTDIAFTSVKDVRTKEQKDYMPTYFLAETLKYLYLTFSPDQTYNFNDYVFSTEAHPFKKSLFGKIQNQEQSE